MVQAQLNVVIAADLVKRVKKHSIDLDMKYADFTAIALDHYCTKIEKGEIVVSENLLED